MDHHEPDAADSPWPQANRRAAALRYGRAAGHHDHVRRAVRLPALLPPVAAVLTVCIRGISTTELLGVVHLTLIITGISVCLGGLLGYLAGLLIAGVFFFFNKWQPPLEDEEPPEEKITPSPVIQENEEQVSAE